MRLGAVPHRRPPAREEALPAGHGDKDAVEAARPQRRGWARGRADDDVSGASSRSIAEIECGQIGEHKGGFGAAAAGHLGFS